MERIDSAERKEALTNKQVKRKECIPVGDQKERLEKTYSTPKIDCCVNCIEKLVDVTRSGKQLSGNSCALYMISDISQRVHVCMRSAQPFSTPCITLQPELSPFARVAKHHKTPAKLCQ